jgi:hypothetical protein
MAVKVTRGAVDTGARIYKTGELIVGLSDNDELDLVKKGVCEAVYLFTPPAQSTEPESPEDKQQNSPQEASELPDGVEQLPGGFFLLPNGEKVRGRAKALERLAELEAAKPDGEKTPVEGGDPEGGPNTSIPGLA